MGRTVRKTTVPARAKRQLPYRFKTVPFDHQLECWKVSKDEEVYAYFMEMGTGKTKVAIDTLAYLYDKGLIDGALIFANKGSYLNWVNLEIPTHMPEHVRYRVVAWDNSQTKRNQAIHRDLLRPSGDLTIFVMNIEALISPRSRDLAQRFVISYDAMMIVDESTTIKNPKAKRTKAATVLGRFARYKRIMTGMPVTNSPLDVYSQCSFLRRGILGFTSYYSFRAHFANLIDVVLPMRHSFKKVVGYQNLDELTTTLREFSFIVSKEDCLDLPPKVYERYEVPLTEEQSRLYRQLKEEALAELSECATVTAPLVITRMLRLHQLVCGHLTDDTGRVHDVPTNRLAALDAVLEEIRGQVVIWANYRHSLRQVEAHLGGVFGHDQVVTYYGATRAKDRERAIRLFQAGKVRFFVGNPQTAGHGLTLTASSHHVYYSNNFSLEMRAQSEDRSHRIGQKRSVTYVDLYTPKTVDEKILKALRVKRDLADLVMNWREVF